MNRQPMDLARAARRLDGRAWGIAGGLVLGLGLLGATNFLLLRGADPGQPIGPTLGLLRNYLPGFSVSVGGSLLGFVYAFFLGYVAGRALALVYGFGHDAVMGTGLADETLKTGEGSLLGIRRLNGPGWGLAGGITIGLGLFAATAVLLLRGAAPGQPIGPTLGVLGYFLPGYSVSPMGSVVGFVYGFGLGYLIGRSVATVYNRLVENIP